MNQTASISIRDEQLAEGQGMAELELAARPSRVRLADCSSQRRLEAAVDEKTAARGLTFVRPGANSAVCLIASLPMHR